MRRGRPIPGSSASLWLMNHWLRENCLLMHNSSGYLFAIKVADRNVSDCLGAQSTFKITYKKWNIRNSRVRPGIGLGSPSFLLLRYQECKKVISSLFFWVWQMKCFQENYIPSSLYHLAVLIEVEAPKKRPKLIVIDQYLFLLFNPYIINLIWKHVLLIQDCSMYVTMNISVPASQTLQMVQKQSGTASNHESRWCTTIRAASYYRTRTRTYDDLGISEVY